MRSRGGQRPHLLLLLTLLPLLLLVNTLVSAPAQRPPLPLLQQPLMMPQRTPCGHDSRRDFALGQSSSEARQ